MQRRQFISNMGAAAIVSKLRPGSEVKEPLSLFREKMNTSSFIPLKVKPVLVYHLFDRIEASTWREWGGLRTQADVDNETDRIEKELKVLKIKTDVQLDILPLDKVNSDESARKVSEIPCDVLLVYAAGSAGDRVYKQNRMDMLLNAGKPVVMFLRHKSGPVYLWYEIVHPKLLRAEDDFFQNNNLQINDIVVDNYDEVLWRLRALYGLRNTANTKLVAVNGIGGWRVGREVTEALVKNTWKMVVADISNEEVSQRLAKKKNNLKLVENTRKEMEEYLSQPGVLSVHTDKQFILYAFLLRDVFKDLMAENNAGGITVQGCMNIGKIAETTACLAFSLINDEGSMAFCESDFVVIPSGVLLRYISGKPVFLNDPTFPHNGITTCAHCSSPRRMNGRDLEPVHILTHCESDYGAAPKVLFRKEQEITNIIPDFKSLKWLGFKGKIIDHPSYDICRSQFDCTIDGNWKKLLTDMRGFHWMTCYGDYLREIRYACRKTGIEFENISE